MSKDEKENRINSLALTFLERQQVRPNIFADQIIRGYKEGYHQAEKDLELTWEDIAVITDIWDDLHEDESVWSVTGTDTPAFYQEVLKRFNKERKGK